MLSREVFAAKAARLAETLDELRNGTGPAVERLLLQAWDDGFQAQSAENAALAQQVEELKKKIAHILEIDVATERKLAEMQVALQDLHDEFNTSDLCAEGQCKHPRCKNKWKAFNRAERVLAEPKGKDGSISNRPE